jgi:RecA-family ATPase
VSRRGPYDLIVIDPLARVSGASVDKDNAAAAALIGFFEQLSAAAQGLVFVPHHTDKIARREGIIDATAVRGATGLGDSARMVTVLATVKVDHGDTATNERIGDVPVLHCAKANGVRRWDPIELRRTDDGTLVPLDAIDRAAVRDAAQGRSKEGRETARRQEAEARLESLSAYRDRQRAEYQLARAQAKRAELEEDDRVARTLRIENPTLSHTKLRSKFLLLRSPCGEHRANDALHRTAQPVSVVSKVGV